MEQTLMAAGTLEGQATTLEHLWHSTMISLDSISREMAAERFPFLAQRYSGRRNAIKEFTHRDPDFVFWIYPDGRLHTPATPMPRTYLTAMSRLSMMSRITAVFCAGALRRCSRIS
jgi:hypothetical protein